MSLSKLNLWTVTQLIITKSNLYNVIKIFTIRKATYTSKLIQTQIIFQLLDDATYWVLTLILNPPSNANNHIFLGISPTKSTSHTTRSLSDYYTHNPAQHKQTTDHTNTHLHIHDAQIAPHMTNCINANRQTNRSRSNVLNSGTNGHVTA